MDATSGRLAIGLYEALLDGAGLLAAVQGLADQLGATSHAVHMVRYRNGRPQSSVSAGRGGTAGPALEEYARFWVRHDPWARIGATLPLGVHDMSRLVPPEELERSRIWNEWGRQNGAAFYGLNAILSRSGDTTGRLVFHRRPDAKPFTPEHERLLTELFPHLQRVFAAEAQLSLARDAAGPALRAGLDALPEGVALLDTERRLAFANLALRRMAAMRDGMELAALGGLAVPDPGTRVALSRAVTAALAALDGHVGLLPAAGSLALPRPSGAAPWLLRALPVMRTDMVDAPIGFRGVMLLVTDGEKRVRPNAALLMRLFNLTGAEAALASALAAGKTLAEHAAARGISPETARSHLAAIRRKTGCRRQADLAAMLARLPA